MQYVAFLRGINVGGNVLIKMLDLKKCLEDAGYKNVRTILASGNVVFDSSKKEGAITKDISSVLKRKFKRDISIIVRSKNHLRILEKSNPFKGIRVSAHIRLYVTFLPKEQRPKSITLPFATPEKEIRILSSTGVDVFSVVDLSKGKGTLDAMQILEKEFGKNITTRNWNTVAKILK